MGTGMHCGLMISFKGGRGDYMLGGHPVWEVLRSVYQMSKRPYVFGACFRLAGFVWAIVMRVEKPVPKELVEFRRKEQMHRLRKVFSEVFAFCRRKLKGVGHS